MRSWPEDIIKHRFGKNVSRYIPGHVERLENVLNAILTIMSGEQRLEIMNLVRDDVSEDSDYPIYVSKDEEESDPI